MSAKRLLDLTTLLPGLVAARHVHDVGWSVCKLTPPGGDPMAQLDREAYQRYLAADEVVEADLKTPAGQTTFDELLGGADVVLESYRAETAERLGVTPRRVAAVGASLVSIRGFTLGDAPDLPGHDITYMAASGAACLSGLLAGDGRPAYWGMQVSNFAVGTVAALRCLAAGPGEHHTLGMDEVLAEWLVPRSLALNRLGRAALATWVTPPGYGFYRSRDQRWLAFGVREEKFVRRMAEAYDLPAGWTDDDLREALAQRDLADIAATAQRWKLPYAPVVDLAHALELLDERAVSSPRRGEGA